jgi:CBS domain-containing protein
MKVKDAMHKRATWVTPDTTIRAAAKLMRDEDIGAIPVGENDRLVGMITDRDIACRGLANGKDVAKLTVGRVMTKPIVYCRAKDKLEAAAKIMEKKGVRRLPVIDENKRMVGMLSLGDISSKAPKLLSGEVLRAVSAHHR